MNPKEISEVLNSIKSWKSKPSHDGCLYGKSKCQSPIASHLISKCVLKLIAENGCVFNIRPPDIGEVIKFKEFRDESLLEMSPVKFGISKQASTFPGFCRKCDNRLFESIDSTSMDINRRNIQLLAYRAISQATAIKYQMMGAMLHLKQASIAQFMAMTMGVSQLEQWIGVSTYQEEFTKIINHSKDTYEHLCITIDKRLPFAASGSFKPYILANGKKLNERDEWLMISVIPQENHSIISFTWKKVGSKNCGLFIKSLLRVSSSLFGEWIFRYSLEVLETIFVSPKWWRNLNERHQNLYQNISKPYSNHPKGIELDKVEKPEAIKFLSINGKTNIKGGLLETIKIS